MCGSLLDLPARQKGLLASGQASPLRAEVQMQSPTAEVTSRLCQGQEATPGEAVQFPGAVPGAGAGAAWLSESLPRPASFRARLWEMTACGS